MKRSLYYIALTLLIVGFYVSCGNSPLSRLFERGGTNVPTGTVVGDPLTPPGSGGCGVDTGEVDCTPPVDPASSSRTDSWVQPTDLRRPVDLIFVQDTSSSLADERAYVTTALSGFLSTLRGQGINDYCIGVMLAQAQDSRTGLLRSYNDTAGANTKCLCSNVYSSDADLLAQFKLNFEKSLPVDPTNLYTNGGEVGLYSFNKSISDAAKITANQATGCFRDTALLAPVFISDENDLSTSRTALGEPGASCSVGLYTFDPVGPDVGPFQCEEAEGRKRYYSDSSGNLILGYNQVYNHARDFQGVLPLMASVIGYVGPVIPAVGVNGAPAGYSELADLTGGDKVDLKYATDGNQSGFNAAFDNLADAVIKAATLHTVFDLSAKPCVGSLVVKVDGTSISTFTWNGNRRVTIPRASAGSQGSDIVIKYNVCS